MSRQTPRSRITEALETEIRKRDRAGLVCVARRVTNFLREPHHTLPGNSGVEDSPFQPKLHSHVHMKESLSRP